MCGIIGRISGQESWAAPLDLGSIRHRGPDASGQERLGAALLGHTRLSIIDLGGGAQPMTDLEGLATIVFNGEIYNHNELRVELEQRGCRFRSASDTEVILAAYRVWGVPGFARLRGMYAFAIADRRDGTTILARDPLGIKPLFLCERGGGTFFSSELGALVEMIGETPDLDLSSVLETLLHRYPAGDHTVYKGIRRLEPGTALIVDRNGSSSTQVVFQKIADSVDERRHQALGWSPEEVAERVSDSVRHHAIADVPLGCFLSGGLDSSIVAQSLAEQAGGRLQAYSVSFEGAQSEQSELPYARAVADSIGADLTEVRVSARDFADLAPRLSGTLNGPFPDHADIAMLKLSMAAAKDVKVVLSGEGSDEAFAGYPKYAADRFASLSGAMGLLAKLTGRRSRLGIAVDAWSESNPAKRWMRWFQNDTVPTPIVRALLGGGAEPSRALGWVEERVARYPADWSNMQRMQVLDLESWLPNNLLHRGDYTTMQASLEQRVPFLDIELTPWAVALPDRAKVRRLTGKMPLRRAWASKLPRSVIERRKSGFRLPLGEWLRTDPTLRSMANDHLLSPNARLRDLIGNEELNGMLAPAALASTGGAKLAWTALCLELWLRSVSASSLRAANAPQLHAKLG